MKAKDLMEFISNKMRPDKAHGIEKNYQPIVIKFLNQSPNGIRKKKEIIEELQKENQDNPVFPDAGTLETVTQTLLRNKIIKRKEDSLELLDFETFKVGEKAEITKRCEQRISQHKNKSKNYLQILGDIISKFKKDRKSISSTWDVHENEEAENKRKEFTNKYTLENISNLSLEHFADGKRDVEGNKIGNNFCSDLYKIPFGSLQSPQGMRIYGIYYEKDTQNIWFDNNIAKTSDEVLKKIKNAIIKTIELGKKSNFKEIEKISDIQAKFQSNILAAYFPEKMLMIHNKGMLSEIALDFELFTKKQIKEKSLFDIQQALLKFKDSQDILQELNNLEYSHILWYYKHGVEKDLKLTTLKHNADNMTINLEPFIQALEWKPNLILYGPPGTGKTYHANKIAEAIAGSRTKIKEMSNLAKGAKIILDEIPTQLEYNDFKKLASEYQTQNALTPEESITRDIRANVDDLKDKSLFTYDSPKYGLNLPTTFVRAAEIILLAENKPLHSDIITKIAMEKNMILQQEQLQQEL